MVKAIYIAVFFLAAMAAAAQTEPSATFDDEFDELNNIEIDSSGAVERGAIIDSPGLIPEDEEELEVFDNMEPDSADAAPPADMFREEADAETPPDDGDIAPIDSADSESAPEDNFDPPTDDPQEPPTEPVYDPDYEVPPYEPPGANRPGTSLEESLSPKRYTLHHIGAFSGVTYLSNVDQGQALIGFYYENQRVRSSFGYGASIQFHFGRFTEILFAAPVYFKPAWGLSFWAAPGIAYAKSVSYTTQFIAPGDTSRVAPVPSPAEPSGTANYFFRFGGGWRFEFKGRESSIFVTPFMNYDWLNVEELYFTIGCSFEIVLDERDSAPVFPSD